jgi:Mg2+ and Co2+ transporter CorA
MLRSEIPFPTRRWPARVLAVLLGESFLGLLAILATALTLVPMLFPLDDEGHALVETAQWGIIAWFAFEYAFAFACAPQRAAFLGNPWRLVDLLTILIPLASLLPSVSSALRSSPVLRLIRLVRLVTLGVRASGIVVRSHAKQVVQDVSTAPAQVARIRAGKSLAVTPATLTELLSWLKAPAPGWYHLAQPSKADLNAVGQALQLQAGFLETHLSGATYPHLLSAGNFTGLFAWIPEHDVNRRIQRHGVLFLARDASLFSLSRASASAIEDLGNASDEDAALPPLAIVLENISQRHERLIGAFEEELRALEDLPVRESRPDFFERTFRLKKDLSMAQADLWRLKGVVAEFGDDRRRVSEDEVDREIFRRLATRMDYSYETVLNIREGVLSLIDLHLNIVSFDMNRVMRVLAVVSVLGLVPAVVGGLFGMNLIDNPWPFTLPQVAFSISLVMVICLYSFFVKGWLR